MVKKVCTTFWKAVAFVGSFFAMDKYQSPVGLPDEHARLVGIISAHWEYVEEGLNHLLASIMMKPLVEVNFLIRNINFGRKHDLIMAYSRVFEKPKPEVFEQITSGLAALWKAHNLRNKYVHASWVLKDGAWSFPEIKTKGTFKVYDETPTTAQMAADAQFIWDAGDSLLMLFHNLGLPLPWPDKSEPRLPEDRPVPGPK